MYSLDMKYTSLYWALRFVENELDTHVKKYNKYSIIIEAELQRVNYGRSILVINEECKYLKRHKDFVILECIDRLLTNGFKPEDIKIDGRENHPDIIFDNKQVYCEQWGSDYLKIKDNFIFLTEDTHVNILYTSRLVSGLLEYKNTINYLNDEFNYGVFEIDANKLKVSLTKTKVIVVEETLDNKDFIIIEDELIQYTGSSQKVKVPEGITTIGASAFWNNTYVKSITLPKSLERIGGDAFYYCTNLQNINIPKQVWIMGNNPFAGCPNLIINNQSKNFILEDGVLFNKDKTNLIHYTISKKQKEYKIPLTVICLGKHSLYKCVGLNNVVIPQNVIRFENNPFSGCINLNVENHSHYYHFDRGIIYNKFKTTIVGVLNNTMLEKFIVPDSVTLISRNSFWNCKGIKEVVLSKNIERIGYNPFASCEHMIFTSHNDRFRVVEGILYNHDLTELICCTNIVAKNKLKIREEVRYINRGAFSGCKDLKYIDLSNVISIAKSAFTSCESLERISIPKQVEYIGEWAFAYCQNLKVIEVDKNTIIGLNALNECPAKIIVRG